MAGDNLSLLVPRKWLGNRAPNARHSAAAKHSTARMSSYVLCKNALFNCIRVTPREKIIMTGRTTHYSSGVYAEAGLLLSGLKLAHGRLEQIGKARRMRSWCRYDLLISAQKKNFSP